MKLTSEMVEKITKAADIAAPVFVEQDWRWKHDEEPFRPSAGDIYDNLRRFIEDADPTTRAISSGRLMVRFSPDDNEGEMYLSLGHFDLVNPA